MGKRRWRKPQASPPQHPTLTLTHTLPPPVSTVAPKWMCSGLRNSSSHLRFRGLPSRTPVAPTPPFPLISASAHADKIQQGLKTDSDKGVHTGAGHPLCAREAQVQVDRYEVKMLILASGGHPRYLEQGGLLSSLPFLQDDSRECRRYGQANGSGQGPLRSWKASWQGDDLHPHPHPHSK